MAPGQAADQNNDANPPSQENQVPAIEVSHRPVEDSGPSQVVTTEAPDPSLNASGGSVPEHRSVTPIQENSIPPATAQENATPPDTVREKSTPPDTARENSTPPDTTRENAIPAGGTSRKKRDLAEEAVKRFKKSPKTKGMYDILETFIKDSKTRDADDGTEPKTRAGDSENRDAGDGTEPKMRPRYLLDRLEGMQRVKSNDGDSEAEKESWDNLKVKIGEWTDNVVNVLEQVVPVGDVVTSFDPVHAALPWAGMKAVLTVSKPLCHLPRIKQNI